MALGRSEAGAKYDLTSTRYELVKRAGRHRSLPAPLRFYGFPDETAAYYENAAFLPDLVLELERMLKSIFYVGPLRENPRRLYLWSGEIPDHVGQKGFKRGKIRGLAPETFSNKSVRRCAIGPAAYFSSSTESASNDLPSMYSKNAPPPVDT